MMHRQSSASPSALFLFCAFALFFFSHHFVFAQESIPPELQDAQIREKLGNQLHFEDLTFNDEQGKPVALQKYFDGRRPVILTFLYYGCPSLCGYFLNGFLTSLKQLSWNVGDRFQVITLSIDPREKSDLALQKKTSVLESYSRPGADQAWHFLTGDESTIRKLAHQVGFGYRYDIRSKEYAHSTAAIILTPQGKVSRYLHGISFEEKDLRLALLEASNGKIGTLVDRAILFCFHYNPSARGYSLASFRLMQTASALSTILLTGYLFFYWRRQRRHTREVEST